MRPMSGRKFGWICVVVGLVASASALADMGRTTGNWGVSSAGSADYSIPIWTQPGPRSMQPSMAFVYDSQSGNGTMGVGWALSGFGSIDRCPQTIAEDGIDLAVTVSTTDRFCLNGNKLRITSGPLSTYGSVGAVYQAEIAEFSRVTSVGSSGTGPQSFLVHAKNGLIYEYGNTNDSRVILSGTSVYRWLLNKVSDRDGNSYVITYTTDNAVGRVPLSVQWGPTAAGGSTYQYQASLTYSTKTSSKDFVSFVQQGITFPTTQRLDSVAIGYSASGSSYSTKRQYALTYETSPTTSQSRLTQIKECASSTSTCLKPTTITYQNGNAGVQTSGLTAVASASAAVVARKADFNGDGRSDIAYSDGSVWRVAFSTGSGFTSGVSTGIPSTSAVLIGRFISAHQDGFIRNVSGTIQYVGYDGASFTATSTGTTWANNTVVTDYDGDGLQDLMWYTITNNTGGTITARLFLRQNTTTGAATVPTFSSSTTNSMTFANLSSGGGLAIVDSSKCPYGRQCDINGDGRADLQLVVANPQGCGPSGCSSTYTGYDMLGGTVLVNATPQQVPVYYGLRFNDDTCTDTIRNGTNTLRLSSCGDGAVSNITLPATPIAVMDWDGDGRTDLLVNSGGFIGVYRSRGSAATPFDTLFTTTIPYSSTCNYFAADVDGDGLDELACAKTSSPFSVTYYTHNGGGSAGSSGGTLAFATQVPDMVASITDGYGISVTPSYVSTAQGGRYTRGTGTTLPLVDNTDPIIVVGKLTVSDGIGGTYDLDYSYKGARRNAARGATTPRLSPSGNLLQQAEALFGPAGQSVGFEEVTVVDSRNGLKQRTTFEQLYPLVGMVKKSEVIQPDSTPISVATYTNLSQALDATANNQRYYTYLSQVGTDSYEVGGSLNGQLITNSVRTFGYTSFTYGNVTSDTTVVTDKDSATTPSQYNSTWTTAITRTFDSPLTSGTDWCVGLVTQEQLAKSSTAAGVSPVTRTVGYTADTSNPSKCRTKTKTTEPSSSQYKVTETYGFDGFGNINSMQVVGRQPIGGGAFGDMAPRSTSIDWGTSGQQPVSVTDPVGAIHSASYNPEDGTLKEAFDANSTGANVIKTSYTYDGFTRQVRVTRPDGTYTTRSYDDCASAGCLYGTHKLTVTETDYDDLGGIITDRTIYKDALDRTLVARARLLNGVTWNGTYQWVETQFDALGQVYKQYMPCMTASATSSCRANAVTTSYDLVGRSTQISRPRSQSDGTPQVASIGYAGRTQSTTDALGQVSTRIANVDATIRQIKDANNYAINYAYDAAGSVISISDSAGLSKLSSVTTNYGVQPFQVAATDSALGLLTRSYNSLGELIAWTDAKGQTFSATYDALSRPLTRLEPDASTSTTWTWGSSAAQFNVGQLRHVESTANGETYAEDYSYDNRGRPQTKSIVVPGQGAFNYDYAYDQHKGWLDTLTYPQSTPGYRLALKYAYQNGVVQSVSDANAPATIFWTASNSNSWGQVTQQTVGSGVTTTKVFDEVTARLASIQSGTGGNPASIQNLSYLYDLAGNVTQRQNNKFGLTETFYYGGAGDNLYRLQHSDLNNGSTTITNLALTYDPGGNILTKTQPVDDPPVSQSITWTSYNYPAQITTGGQTASFSYGPDRQRWRMTFDSGSGPETTFYIGGLLERVSVGSLYNFRHTILGGDGTVVALYNRPSTGGAVLRYVLADHQGSAESFVESDTLNVTNVSFTALGLRRNAATWSGEPDNRAVLDDITRQGYTFQTALGSMGLNHMNGRVQDAVAGKFLSPDPYITNPNYTQNYNRYAYVYGNPLSLTDPSGFDTCFDVTINILPSLSTSATAPELEDLEEIVVSATRIQPTVHVCITSPTIIHQGDPGNEGGGQQGGGNGNKGSTDGGHDYRARNQVCKRPLTQDEEKDLISRFTVPNDGTIGNVQTKGTNMVWRAAYVVPGGFVTTTFADDGLSGRNVTQTVHVFAGTVDRWIDNTRSGAFMMTHGYGGYGSSNYTPPNPYASMETGGWAGSVDLGGMLDSINDSAGPAIFNHVDEKAAEYAKAHFPGC